MNLNPDILDLVIERSTYGLSAENQIKLNQLIEKSQNPAYVVEEVERFELSLAAVELSLVNPSQGRASNFDKAQLSDSSLSPALTERIGLQAIEAIQSNMSPTDDDEVILNRPATPLAVTTLGKRRPRFKGILVWTVAAASLLALALFIRQSSDTEQALVEDRATEQVQPQDDLVEDIMPADELMKKFLGSTPEDLLTLSWTPVDNKNVTGKVFWSDQQQSGFMALRGLEVNDPQQKQYQVWIFDTDTNEKRPVNGGVFDVPKTGPYFVPIAPLSPVKKAVQFSITAEQPGGVDVSERKHVPTVASKPF